MTAENNNQTFGYYLKTARDQKGMSIEEISDKIKVAASMIRHIENEAHALMPAEVFVKGFLRIYAEAVDVDVDWVIQNYISSYRAYTNNGKGKSDPNRTEETVSPKLFFISCCVIIIICLGIVFFLPDQDRLANRDAGGQQNINTASNHEQTQENHKKAIQNNSQKKTENNGYRLRIFAMAPAGLKIIVDYNEQQTYALKRGDRLQFEASSGFNILIGDAAALKLTLNDKPFRVHGKVGQIVNVQIP